MDETSKKTTSAVTEAEKVFLPLPEEIDGMHEIVFKDWIDYAFKEIPQRKIMRDPLYHLKKEISKILKDDNKSPIAKEDAIYDSIRVYYKLIRRQSQLKKSI